MIDWAKHEADWIERERKHKLMVSRPRIRRPDKMPDRYSEEVESQIKFPRVIHLDGKNGRTKVRYRVKKSRIMGEDGYGCVQRRKIFALIEIDGVRSGLLRFNEYDIDFDASEEDFLYTMDLEEGSETCLSQIICDEWHEVAFISDFYGSIVEFEAVWMSPLYARKAIWVEAAEALIAREFQYSIMLLKAFPLEYGGLLDQGAPINEGFAHRRAAMFRYYQRLLGMEPCSEENAAEGWMWRANPDVENDIRPYMRHQSELAAK